MAILQTSRHGLTQTEAEQRLKQHGPNRLKPPRKRSAWSRFLLQFHNMLIYVLLASGNRAGAMWTAYRLSKGIEPDIAFEEGRTAGMQISMEEKLKASCRTKNMC